MSNVSVTSDFREMALLIRSYQLSKMLEITVSIGLADRLNSEPKSAIELASECGANAEMLLRLCRALAAFGIYSVDAAQNITHTPKSRWLRSDANPTLHYAARFWCMPSIWSMWGNFEHAIRTGTPPFEAVHGMPYFEFMGTHTKDAEIFNRYMQHSPDDRHAAVAEAYDFSGAGVVVDVGGGNGALLAAILAGNPTLHGILFDQEAVVADAPGTLQELSARCTVRTGSFFDSVPAGGDIYTMSMILHDWNDEKCHRILANCREAVKPGGRVLIIDRVLDAGGENADPIGFLADMQMMALFPGARERTRSEFAQLLAEAGFAEPRVIPTRSPFSIVEASATK